jgi:hypothetical protein
LTTVTTDEERADRGTRVRREVLGDAHVDRAIASTIGFTAPIQDKPVCRAKPAVKQHRNGLGGLADWSSRRASCSHQKVPVTEARIVALRREHPGCPADGQGSGPLTSIVPSS